MSDLITSQMLSDWRANYGLDKRTPIKAMHWWQDNMDGKAPAGVVAALGLCINEIERLTAERDKARAERDALADVLPGYYYMDPPDGGNVPVLEQLRRMAKDAERYRFLSCKGVPPYFHRCSRWRLEYWNGEWWDPLMKEELDAAIDAAMGGSNAG